MLHNVTNDVVVLGQLHSDNQFQSRITSHRLTPTHLSHMTLTNSHVTHLFEQFARAVPQQLMKANLHLEGHTAQLDIRFLVLCHQECHTLVLIGRSEDVAQRYILEAFVLTNIII